MEIDRIIIKNIGPFDELDLEINGESVAFIGENASGKTLLISSLVDFVFEHLRNTGFQDVMKIEGNTYNYFRITTNNFLKNPSEPGAIWISGKINNYDIYYLEEYGYNNKKEVSEAFHVTEFQIPWPEKDKAKAISSLNEEQKKEAQNHARNIPIFFLPATRFEKESWKTEKYFDTDITIEQPFDNTLGHHIELYKSFKDNYVWLTNTIFNMVHFGNGDVLSEKWNAVNSILSKLLGKKVKVKISPDINDRLCIEDDSGCTVVRSFSHLSLGQILVLNIILSILGGDKFNVPIKDIKGLVIIDEVDAHLTGIYKTEVLPSVIELFPKVQFLITTHDPLSVIGFDKYSGIKLLELPTGHEILAKNFKEVKYARENLKAQNKELHRIINEIKEQYKPILIVEDEHLELYKIAWLKNKKINFDRDNLENIFSQYAPFGIVSAKGHINLRAFLELRNLPQDIMNINIVGLFDFDQAFNSFNGLEPTLWGDIMGNDSDGLYKTNVMRRNHHALMLPVPYQRHKMASLKYKGNSRLPIELYFSNRCLGVDCKVDEESPGKIMKFSGHKNAFWLKCIEYEPSNFNNFKKLFKKVYELLGIQE